MMIYSLHALISFPLIYQQCALLALRYDPCGSVIAPRNSPCGDGVGEHKTTERR